jgi:hypothetical protein
MNASLDSIKELRELTSCGVIECKKALEEAKGDIKKAKEILQKRGLEIAAKKGSRTAKEGRVESYVHLGNKIGVIVEVNCETDFVARSEDFCKFTKDIALHIAAMAPKYIRKEDIPADVLAQQKDNVVAEFPVYSWRMLKYAYREDDRLLYQAQHGKILYNGVSGFTPPAREAEMDNLWKTFPSHKTLAALQQQGVSLILLHFGEYDQLHQDQFTYLDTLSPSSTTVHAELKQLPELELLTCQGSDCLYHLTGVVH